MPHAFDKRSAESRGNTVGNLDVPSVKEKLLRSRKVTVDKANAALNAQFKEQFELHYPNFTYSKIRKVNCVKDLVQAVRVCEYNNEMRAIIFCVLHSFFNQGFVLELEKQILANFGWEYSDEDVHGATKSRMHPGGSIKDIIIKQKTVITNPIRNAVKKLHCEGFHVRKGDTSDEAAARREKKGLAPIKDSGPKLVQFQKATKECSGFLGWIAVYEGHPDLVASKEGGQVTNMSNNKEEIMKVVEAALESGRVVDVSGLIKSLQERADDATQVSKFSTPSEATSTLNHPDDNDVHSTVSESNNSVSMHHIDLPWFICKFSAKQINSPICLWNQKTSTSTRGNTDGNDGVDNVSFMIACFALF